MIASRKPRATKPEAAKPAGAADGSGEHRSILTRRLAQVGDIVQVSRGQWCLKECYPHTSFKKREDAVKEASQIIEAAGAAVAEAVKDL